MTGLQDIKRRIKSISNTKQITKAMELVAASKLRKARKQLDYIRPYYTKIHEAINRISTGNSIRNEMIAGRHVDRMGCLVITGDRGLSGGYSMNAVRKAVEFIDKNKDSSIIIVGKKGRDFFYRKNIDIIAEFTGMVDTNDIQKAGELGEEIRKLYLNKSIDQVNIIYTRFESAVRQEVKEVRLLPVLEALGEGPGNAEDNSRQHDITLYEPSPEKVLDLLIPMYVDTFLHGVLLESSTSEHGARMTAMSSATENAQEMIDDLVLKLNRARQGSITMELSEIVSGIQGLRHR